MTARAAKLWFDGWAGRYSLAVDVIGETPSRYRVRFKQAGHIAGRGGMVWAGDVRLVPKRSVSFDAEVAHD